MVRFSFLPSDFHPMVLFLGEAPSLRRFACLLRAFARDQAEIALQDSDALFTADDTKIQLICAERASGMQQIAGTVRSFTWNLEPWQAEEFANMLDELTEPECKSGSAMLEAAHGEIKVKVSLGEYTEDFLAKEEFARESL